MNGKERKIQIIVMMAKLLWKNKWKWEQEEERNHFIVKWDWELWNFIWLSLIFSCAIHSIFYFICCLGLRYKWRARDRKESRRTWRREGFSSTHTFNDNVKSLLCNAKHHGMHININDDIPYWFTCASLICHIRLSLVIFLIYDQKFTYSF